MWLLCYFNLASVIDVIIVPLYLKWNTLRSQSAIYLDYSWLSRNSFRLFTNFFYLYLLFAWSLWALYQNVVPFRFFILFTCDVVKSIMNCSISSTFFNTNQRKRSLIFWNEHESHKKHPWLIYHRINASPNVPL